jgi:hypothetical protein
MYPAPPVTRIDDGIRVARRYHLCEPHKGGKPAALPKDARVRARDANGIRWPGRRCIRVRGGRDARCDSRYRVCRAGLGGVLSEFGVEVVCSTRTGARSRGCSKEKYRSSSRGSKHSWPITRQRAGFPSRPICRRLFAGADAVFIAVGPRGAATGMRIFLTSLPRPRRSAGVDRLCGHGDEIDSAGRYRPAGCRDPAANAAAGRVRRRF